MSETWPVDATAGAVRAMLKDNVSYAALMKLPEPAATVVGALVVGIGDLSHEPGVNPPDDAVIQFRISD